MKCEFYLSGLPVKAFPNRPSERISRRVFFRRFVRPDTNRLPPVCGGPTGQRGPGKLQAPSEPAYNAHFSYLSSYCLQIDLSIRTRPIEKCHANGTCYLRLTDVCHPINYPVLFTVLYEGTNEPRATRRTSACHSSSRGSLSPGIPRTNCLVST